MNLSVLITSLPVPPEESLRMVADAEFRHVDLIGKARRGETERNALADSGLVVDCVALGRDLPAGSFLDAANVENRRRAMEEVQQQIAEAAQIGARTAYVVPCKSATDLPAFADSCRILADFARQRMVRLCVEHFPGSALPTAAGTLEWLQSSGLDKLDLLLDLGHCLISKEDPCRVADAAGGRLGYVQLDDNDGVGDLHWPLLSGALTESALRQFLDRLRSTYKGGIALELNGKLEQPLQNLVQGKKIVESLW